MRGQTDFPGTVLAQHCSSLGDDNQTVGKILLYPSRDICVVWWTVTLDRVLVDFLIISTLFIPKRFFLSFQLL